MCSCLSVCGPVCVRVCVCGRPQLHRALFLEQRRQGNVRFGLYLSTRLDGLLWHALTVRVASVDPTSNAQDEALLTRFVQETEGEQLFCEAYTGA